MMCEGSVVGCRPDYLRGPVLLQLPALRLHGVQAVEDGAGEPHLHEQDVPPLLRAGLAHRSRRGVFSVQTSEGKVEVDGST